MRQRIECIGVIAAIALASSPVAAQEAAPAVVQPTRDLSVRASIATGVDDNSLAAQQSFGDAFSQLSGAHFDGTVGLTYSEPGRRTGFAAAVTSAYRVYQGADSFVVWSHHASAALSRSFGPRVRLQANGMATYSPRYELTMFPTSAERPVDSVPGPSFDYSLTPSDVLSYQSAVRLSAAPTPRSTFDVGYMFGQANFGAFESGLTSHDASAYFRRGMTRNLALRFGYRFQQGDFGLVATRPGATQPSTAGGPVRVHNFDVGTDYSRPLSLSRRTTARFRMGSGLVETASGLSFELQGQATLSHGWARTWAADATYERGIVFFQGIAQPFMVDMLTVAARGSLLSKLQLTASADYSTGVVGPSSISSDYESYRGVVRLQVPLLRRLSLFSEYVYYHYTFDDVLVVPQTVPQALDRQGVRAGLTLTVPLLQDRRIVAPR